MASAITARIKEDREISVREYLETCAKMCGPLIHMRDEKLHEPIRLRHVSPYTKGRVLTAEDRLEDAKAMTLEKAERELERSYEYDLDRYEDRIKEAALLKKRYEDMLVKVKAWEPPTEEHKHVKEIAIEQLESAIRFDCNTEHFVKPVKQDPQEYINMRIKWCEDELQRARESLAEEGERVEWANTWIKTLQESLEGLDEDKC
jgi:hypothetical protein